MLRRNKRNKEVISSFGKFQYYGIEHPFIVFLSDYLSNHGYTRKKENAVLKKNEYKICHNGQELIAKRYQSPKSNSYYIEFTLFVRIGENGKAFMFGKYKDCSYWHSEFYKYERKPYGSWIEARDYQYCTNGNVALDELGKNAIMSSLRGKLNIKRTEEERKNNPLSKLCTTIYQNEYWESYEELQIFAKEIFDEYFKEGIKSKYQLIDSVAFSRARVKESYPRNIVIMEYYTKAICEDCNRKGEVYLYDNDFIKYISK